MNTLQKILDFFNTPTNQKMNVICIAGIVCTVISLIDKVRMLVFTVYGCWGYWGWMFEELLFDGLPPLLALTAMLLTFLYWKRGNRFPIQPAVPILLLIENLISLLSVFFGKTQYLNAFWTIYSVVMFGFLIFCLFFFIIAMIKSDFHQIALIIVAVVLLQIAVGLIGPFFYDIRRAFDVSGMLVLIVFNAPLLLFCAGWYMKQKEHTET